MDDPAVPEDPTGSMVMQVHFCLACARELVGGAISTPCPVEGCGERVVAPQYDYPRTEAQKVAIWGNEAFVEPRPRGGERH
jgi:hypothetical protein